MKKCRAGRTTGLSKVRSKEMRRVAYIFLAGICCDFYLFTRGMWHGECHCTAWDQDGRVVGIWAAHHKDMNTPTRVFYLEMVKQ